MVEQVRKYSLPEIVSDLQGRIVRGELAPHSLLPERGDIATFYNTSKRTINRVFPVLLRNGVVYAKRGHGTYVAERSQWRLKVPEEENAGDNAGSTSPQISERPESSDIGHVVFPTIKERRPSRRPKLLLSQQQEHILFSHLRHGETQTASLLQDPELQGTFAKLPDGVKESWMGKWERTTRENGTIVGVIAAWNEAMVQKIAKSYMQRDTKDRVIIDEDILSAGREGLLRAIDRFDHTKGTRFASYASYYVIQRIQAEVRGRLGLNAYEIRAAAKARHLYNVVYACGFQQPSQRELENVLLVFTDISPKLISRTVESNLKKRTMAIPFDLGDDSQDTEQQATKGTIWAQLTPAMKDILGELPLIQREIVLMHIVQGKTVFEIAKERHSQPKDIQAILDIGLRSLGTTDQVRRAKQLRDAAQPAEANVVYTSLAPMGNEVPSPVRPQYAKPKTQLTENVDRFLMQGLSNIAIAREAGCSREYVRRRRTALIASGELVATPQVRDEDIDALLVSGHSTKEVRARFHCSFERVSSRREKLLARRVLTLSGYTHADRQQLRCLATAENPGLIEAVRTHLSTHSLPSFRNVIDMRFRQQHSSQAKK